MYNRMHSREKKDSRNSKVPQTYHVLYFTFIKLLTVLSKDFSLTPFACPLCPLFSKAGTPTFGIQTNSSQKYEQGRVT